jgi:hypothetical protein
MHGTIAHRAIVPILIFGTMAERCGTIHDDEENSNWIKAVYVEVEWLRASLDLRTGLAISAMSRLYLLKAKQKD